MPNRALLSAVTLALLVGPVACTTGGSKSSADASSSASAAAANAAIAPSASAHNQRPRRERNGAAGMLFHAAHDLQLSDTQTATLDGIESKLEQGDGPPEELRTFQTDLVAGIRAGKMDKSKLQADIAAFDAASAAHDAKEVDAIASLWAALEPAQRTQLTTAVRAKQQQREAMINAHTPDAGAGFDAGAIDWSKKRLEKMTAQLGLDANQQKSVAAILPKEDWMNPTVMKAERDESNKRVDALLTAFEAPAFDGKKLDLSGSPAKRREGLEKDAAFLGQLVPLLTPDQREKLAAQREHAGMRRGGMGGHGNEGHLGQPGLP
jgi:Spy/CpxP family protein refolding chaperone